MQARQVTAYLFLSAALVFSANLTASEEVHQSEHHDFRVVTVAEDFENPWALAFLPNGDMLVTERPGRLRIIRDGSVLPDPVAGLPPIRSGGQGGLLDVVLHPDFASNRLIYISYAKPNADDSEGTTAVIRARFENDRLHDVEEIFEAVAWDASRGHHGSRLAFDADGYLFISIGDRQSRPVGDLEAHPAQDPTNHYGVLVRIHDDGAVPADNPFVGRSDVLPDIWSYGHRNIQGLAIHPETGHVWATEHGPQGGDELNLIKPGLNYGWPVVGFGVNYGPGTPIHQEVSREGMEDPLLHWTPSIGPSGLMVYSGDQFPRWQGSIFAGGMSAGYRELTRVSSDGKTVFVRESLLPGDYRIRDVREGPDGYIYLVTDHRAGGLTPIVRMEPVR